MVVSLSSREIQKEMLEELKRIREAVEPKPIEAPPTTKGFGEEFIEFLNKYGIIGLAIGFIIGGAAGSLVSALVGDILMPMITFFVPGGAWREAVLILGPINLGVGHFIGSLLDFLMIALIVFILMKQLKKTGLR